MTYPWNSADGREFIATWERALKRPPNSVEVAGLQEFASYVVNSLPVVKGTTVGDYRTIVQSAIEGYATRPGYRTPARDSDLVLGRLHAVRERQRLS